MSWFETLTGCQEESPEFVRQHLSVNGDRLRSKNNGKEWRCGRLETPSLKELRKRVRLVAGGQVTKVREVVGDIQAIHCDESNAGAMFQVASQFNLLEMTSPNVGPEDGLGIYAHDLTQGPACAIAAGAGTIYRNYFASVNGKIGQTSHNQIDCLADVGDLLGNADQQLWRMANGYALPTRQGLKSIYERLQRFTEAERDELRQRLQIGIHADTQVTLNEATHVVSQAYCSAMPISYTEHSLQLWEPLARLILEAAYEATICASIENAQRNGNRQLFLTLLGGGAFGNAQSWILSAIQRAVLLYPDSGLDVAIVSYGRTRPEVKQLAQTLTEQLKQS